LNEERFAWFRQAYSYAATQSNAIPALAKLTPEDTYYLYAALHYGDDRDAPTDAGRVGVLERLLKRASDYLETANQIIIEDAGGDEEDFRDADELVADCRAALSGTPAVSTGDETWRLECRVQHAETEADNLKEDLEDAHDAIRRLHGLVGTMTRRWRDMQPIHGEPHIETPAVRDDLRLADEIARATLAADSGAARQEAPAAAPGGERAPTLGTAPHAGYWEGFAAGCDAAKDMRTKLAAERDATIARIAQLEALNRKLEAGAANHEAVYAEQLSQVQAERARAKAAERERDEFRDHRKYELQALKDRLDREKQLRADLTAAHETVESQRRTIEQLCKALEACIAQTKGEETDCVHTICDNVERIARAALAADNGGSR
jgi:hypothetical protein